MMKKLIQKSLQVVFEKKQKVWIPWAMDKEILQMLQSYSYLIINNAWRMFVLFVVAHHFYVINARNASDVEIDVDQGGSIWKTENAVSSLLLKETSFVLIFLSYQPKLKLHGFNQHYQVSCTVLCSAIH